MSVQSEKSWFGLTGFKTFFEHCFITSLCMYDCLTMSANSELQQFGHTCMYTTCIHTHKGKFFLLEGHLYQEILVFNCFKNNTKRYLIPYTVG